MTTQKFRNTVWKHWRLHGRHDLPWRKTKDPYRILVSEIMLQQTQVERVTPYYKAFLKRFPDAAALAEAPLSEVLILWQGLGYNRRAKMLHEAAKIVVKDYRGKVPTDVALLERLPGIGPYTARAVAAFSANTDAVFIETNIRTAITHHFFNTENSTIYSTVFDLNAEERRVSDAEVMEIAAKVLPKGKAREWYAALMDYGAHLKRSGLKINARSKHYKKQSTFPGSARQARGAILKELTKGPIAKSRLIGLLGDERTAQMETQLGKLLAEKMIVRKGNRYELPT